MALVACLVAGTVTEDDSVLPPVLVLFSKFLGELGQEQAEHLAVRVDLVERAVVLSDGADGQHHGNAGEDGRHSDGVGSAALSPLPTDKVSVPNPGLVNVDDSDTRLEQAEHVLRIPLSKRKAASGVTSVGDALNGLVSDSKILLQHSADVLLRDFDTALIVDCLNNFFRLTEAALAPEKLQ